MRSALISSLLLACFFGCFDAVAADSDWVKLKNDSEPMETKITKESASGLEVMDKSGVIQEYEFNRIEWVAYQQLPNSKKAMEALESRQFFLALQSLGRDKDAAQNSDKPYVKAYWDYYQARVVFEATVDRKDLDDKAISTLKKVESLLSAFPEKHATSRLVPMAVLTLGDLYLATKETGKAEKSYTDLFNNHKAYRALAQIGLARCQLRQGKIPEAVKILLKLAEMKQDFGPILDEVEASLLEKGDHDNLVKIGDAFKSSKDGYTLLRAYEMAGIGSFYLNRYDPALENLLIALLFYSSTRDPMVQEGYLCLVLTLKTLMELNAADFSEKEYRPLLTSYVGKLDGITLKKYQDFKTIKK
ncbi:MAG: tetratricopeptide repeat protein [Planctomycetes bacterium]|nr:tetratricopeptide repeat protein [Planctomycetota bacterium]